MITVIGAIGHTGRKIDESLFNPTAKNVFLGTLSPFLVVGVLIFLGCETAVISANPRQVIVKSSMLDAKESQRLAEAECGKHERYARMALKATNTDPNYTFDCVE